jgi:hypothetical protein
VSTDPARGNQQDGPEAALAGDSPVAEPLLAAPAVGFVIVGPDSSVRWIDDGTERYFGLDGDEAIGTDRSAFFGSHVGPCLERPDEFRAAAASSSTPT